MRLLLDTHILLWSMQDASELPSAARDLIMDEKNQKVVSAVSIWEIAIKHPLKRQGTSAISTSAAQILARCAEAQIVMLPVLPAHAAAVESLPLLHGDPFDRLLVAQALTEPLRLITSDRELAAYSDTVILV